MPLAAGTRLGPYEIGTLLGAGGMGEVYAARDRRLDRAVAIKVLPESLAADPQVGERFDREARAFSQLVHPNICRLYDVGNHAGTAFLVMELLDGDTLTTRLATAPMPPPAALKVAIEIASALDAAHRAGIVHRDLKPGNVMLTTGGAKLLDFGLAKTHVALLAAEGSDLPTTAPLTVEGTILGTFQYMAPEQVDGREADTRSDLFALGAILFEMITGRRAFEGATHARLLSAILKDDPPRVSTVQPLAPRSIDRIVATCLAKQPDDRYQTARELLRDLRWSVAGDDDAAGAIGAPLGRVTRRRVAQGVTAVAGIALLITSVVTMRHFGETQTPLIPVQFLIAPPDKTTFAAPSGPGTGSATQVAVSSDGRHVAFVASDENGYRLHLRSLDTLASRAIPGTDGASFPFWAPDGRYVGFFANGKLLKVDLAGGPPTELCSALLGRGGTWNRDNVILFGSLGSNVLHRVSSHGGVPKVASALDTVYGETSHRFPSFLPDGRHFIYTAVVGTCCPASKPGRVRVGLLDSTETTTLLQAESSALFADGHVLFNRDGTLMARPFDDVSRTFTGDAYPVAENVGSEGSRYASFSASDTGVLVSARELVQPTTRLTWVDRQGSPLGTIGEPAAYVSLALSSDEQRVAVVLTSGSPENRDIWIYDSMRGVQQTKFTFDEGDDGNPVWSPNDEFIIFQSYRQGVAGIHRKRVGKASGEELLSDTPSTPTDWSGVNSHVAYTRSQGVAGSTDVWALPLLGEQKPFPLAQTRYGEQNAVFSPDGRWLAYEITAGGHTDIHLQPFPPTGGTFQISRNGGARPRWRGDSKELFFLTGTDMMQAAVDPTGRLPPGVPTRLFSVATRRTNRAGPQYGVTRDGRRFLVNAVQQELLTLPLTVLVNWRAAAQK